jgi:tetratricopeptide (TPR) repeat protein
MIQPEVYIQEAIKLENSKSVFEYMIKDLTLQRYEKISELYEKAGNIYKLVDRILAIDYMVKSYNYLIQTDYSFNSYKVRKLAGEIAELYKYIDYIKSIEYLEKVLNNYTIQDDISGVIKTYEQIGDIYYTNEHFKEAKKIYLKIIEIVNSSSKSFDVKKNVV